MIETQTVNIPRIKTTAFICDICHKKTTIDDWIEFQEMVHIRHDCGYGSVFGDGETINLDVCQHCFKKWMDKVKEVTE